MGILGTALGYIIGQFVNPADAGRALVADDLVPLASAIQSLTITVDDVLTEADGVLVAARPVATAAGMDVANMGDQLKSITQHTYEVVIPNTLAWFRGEIIRTLIDPLRKKNAEQDREIQFLFGWRAQIIYWRNKYVDPTLARYIAFERWFNTWPRADLTTLHDWITKPGTFTSWAAPILARPLADQYADAHRKPLRDYLTTTIIDASPDVPHHVEQAIVAVLLTEW